MRTQDKQALYFTFKFIGSFMVIWYVEIVYIKYKIILLLTENLIRKLY